MSMLSLHVYLAHATLHCKASAEGLACAQERRYSTAGYTPEGSPSDLRPGTYYLTHVDELYRRFYARREDPDA